MAWLLGITPDKIASNEASVLTEYGHLVETFAVGEILKQVSWLSPMRKAHTLCRLTFYGDDLFLLGRRRISFHGVREGSCASSIGATSLAKGGVTWWLSR